MDKVLFDKQPSVLAPFLGLFTVHIRQRGSGEASKDHYTVQRNVRFGFEARGLSHISFDVKGTWKREHPWEKKKSRHESVSTRHIETSPFPSELPGTEEDDAV